MTEEPDIIETDICCPLADRIEPLRTKSGLPCFDVHKHKRLLRGFVAEGGRNRVMHWLWPHGRLSQAVESDYDLRKALG
jgi:hypothetical protein